MSLTSSGLWTGRHVCPPLTFGRADTYYAFQCTAKGPRSQVGACLVLRSYGTLDGNGTKLLGASATWHLTVTVDRLYGRIVCIHPPGIA